MKVNESLKRFGSAITGLVSSGLLLIAIGLVCLFANSGLGGNPGWLAFGFLLLYLGSGLVGLGIFGAFLKITAKAIVEGLGGSINEADWSGNESQSDTQIAANAQSPAGDPSRLLEPHQRELWQAAGSPELTDWFQSGSTSFEKWLKSRETDK